MCISQVVRTVHAVCVAASGMSMKTFGLTCLCSTTCCHCLVTRRHFRLQAERLDDVQVAAAEAQLCAGLRTALSQLDCAIFNAIFKLCARHMCVCMQWVWIPCPSEWMPDT